MNINELRSLLLSWPKLWRTRNAVQQDRIVKTLDELFPNVPLNLQIDSVIHSRSPYCIICGSVVKTSGKLTCSLSCRSKYNKQYQSKRIEKCRQTLQEKYGVDSVGKIPGIAEKRLATMLEKYGALTSPIAREKTAARARNLNQKGRETLKARYGVKNPSQMASHKEKCAATLAKNRYSKSKERLAQSIKNLWQHLQSVTPPSVTICSVEHPTKFKKEQFKNPNKLITFSCSKCSSTETIPSETFKWRIRNYSTSCTICSGIEVGSAAQQEVNAYIERLGFGTKQNDRTVLCGKEIDIYVPSLRIGFEYNGLFWHNSDRVGKYQHLRKTELAAKLGIQLVHIFENEWTVAKNIVQSRIAHKLQKSSQRIFARKCSVDVIELEAANNFLGQNSLRHNYSFSTALGLFCNERLCAVITFNLTNAQWELTNFCTLQHTAVVGGLSKLFSKFAKLVKPAEVVVQVDRCWDSGASFEKIGFNLEAKSDPTLKEVDLKKKTLSLASGTSSLTIWDCGHVTYEWQH